MSRTPLSSKLRSVVFTSWQTSPRALARCVGYGAWGALALCLGCSARSPMERPGLSRAEADERSYAKSEPEPAPPAAPTVRGIDQAVLDRLVAATDQPYPSQGHEPQSYLVRVWVNPEALEGYRAWSSGATAPVGTWLVAKHHSRFDPPNGPSSLPLYTMHREAEGWRFGAVTPEGAKLPVSVGACHECHSQARADSVFGPPRR